MAVELVRAKWVVKGVKDRWTADVVSDGAVAHEDGVIVAVGEWKDIAPLYPGAAVMNFPKHMLLPGFVNSHHHIGLTPLALGSSDQPLELWFATRLSARDVDIYLDTLYGAMEMIASGITCVQHLHSRIAGPLESLHAGSTKVLDAYRKIGMRASFSYAVREQNRLVYEDDARFCASLPKDVGRAMLQHLKRYTVSLKDQLKLYAQLRKDNAGHKLTAIQLAPANFHWMTDDGLMAVAEQAKADGVPMHMHLLETAYQKEYAYRRTGTTAVKHMHRLGALGPSMTLGHAVWLDEEDEEIIAHTMTCVCHNCSSNYRLRSGVAPINSLERKGVVIALGLDEAGMNDDRDMLLEMRLALRTHRTPGFDENDVPGCAQVLRMATEHGASTTPFKGKIGRLQSGNLFDAVAVDMHAATWPYQDASIAPVDVLVQRAKKEHVDTVYVNGDPIYAKGRFKYVERDKLLEQLAEQLSKPRSPLEEQRSWLAGAVLPHVRNFYADYPAPASSSERGTTK